jgi:coproporphyrinogen III oxidase
MLFNMENRVAGDDIFAGFLDVAPAAALKDDLKFLQTRIKKVTEKYGQDYEALRAKLKDMYWMESWDKALNAEIGIRLELGSDQAALVKEAGLTWVESYVEIVEKRKREQFNEKQNALMNDARARIMEYYLLKDLSVKVAQKLGVPLAALFVSRGVSSLLLVIGPLIFPSWLAAKHAALHRSMRKACRGIRTRSSCG